MASRTTLLSLFQILWRSLQRLCLGSRPLLHRRKGWDTTPAQEEMPPVTPPPEVPLLPEEGTPRRRKPGPQRNTQSAKPKKVTTAELAATMDSLMQAIPTLTSQVEQLHRRQVEFESCLSTTTSSGRPMLSKPLGGLPPQNSSLLGDVMKSIPGPPRTQARAAPGLLASPQVKKPLEVLELENEKIAAPMEDSSLAKAVLAQSQALTTLVTQIAHASSDPMSDLSGSSTTPGSRGSMGRARLQSELAAHRGSFFTSVLAQMARRMNPTSSVEASPKELLERGGEWREVLGEIWRLWQAERSWLPSVPGHADLRLPHGREPHGRSRLGSLLAIILEQMNMDGGRLVVCLHEDPPASIFQMRHLSSTSRSRAFAPLADQKLVTVALAYLKELDVIQSKRLELVGGQPQRVPTVEDGQPKPRPKGAPKRRQKWKEKEDTQEEA